MKLKISEKFDSFTDSEYDENSRFLRYFVPSDKATEYLKKDLELKKYLKQLNRDTNGEILVDPNTKEQIGYGFVYHSGENKGFIFNIEVMKKFRRQGFGKIILNDCVTKFGGIDLTVACDNTPAIELYKKYGFEIVDIVEGQNGRDEYYMKLKKSKTVQEGVTTVIKEPDPFVKLENTYYEGDIMKLRILESNKHDIMKLPTSERVDLMIDLWNDPKFVGAVSTEKAMQYWENKGWDTSRYTSEEFNRIWDLAQDELDVHGYIYDEEEYEEEIETKEDAARWLDSKLAEYGNTYHFPQEERYKLDRLIDRFGSTYFWRR